MPAVRQLPKKEVFKEGSFSVFTYDFTIPNGKRAGDVLNMVELKTTKKRWSDETNSYYDQNHYITISNDQLVGFLKTINSK